MERDEGSYVMYGKWLIEGAKPYIDFYEMKPPGIFLTYGLMVKLFGYEYTKLQLGFCFLNFLTLIISYFVFKKLFERKIALAILPVFGFLLWNPAACGFTIQAEFLVLFFVIPGLYLLFIGQEKNNFFLIICSGILLGFSILIKQNGIFFFIRSSCYYYLRVESKKTKKNINWIFSVCSWRNNSVCNHSFLVKQRRSYEGCIFLGDWISEKILSE